MGKFRCMGCMEEYDDNTTVCPYCGYVKGTPAKEIYQLQPESILSGRYIIGKVLGFGGFGITYIAWDSVLEKKVAVKEYLPSDFATRMPGQTYVSVYEGEKEEQFKSGLRSFIEESQRLAKFNSVDGIVNIYDSFAENGTAYIIMEYLDGRTLKSILKEKGKIPYQEAIGYALPVLYALENVHKAGIIHRDIAPDNIFITNDGKVKLLDFGAARYATTLHSKSLSVILKPGYAPEEQYRTRGNQGPWTDVYAMAATLYRAVTGVIPEDSLERTANDTVKEPSKLGIKLPQNIENAIMNALNIKAEDRIQSAKEFADALAGEIELERVIIKQKKDDVGKWPIWQKGLLGGAVAAVVAVVVLITTGVIKTPLTQDRLPNVIDMSVEDAEKALAPYGYNYMKDSESLDLITEAESDFSSADESNSDDSTAEPSSDIPAETDETSLSGMSFVPMSADMISSGEPTGEVSSDPITESTETANKIRIEDKVYDSDIPENLILAQSPNAGSRINKEKYPDVYLTLSAGAEEIYLPDDSFVGMNKDEVVAKLEELGFTVNVVEQASSEFAPGYIISQDYEPGTKLRKGDTITITVSTGSDGAKVASFVPDVVGRTFEEAKQIINGASLYIAVQREEYSDTVPKGCVISQDPVPGSGATTNETIVYLVISKGSEKDATTRVPDVTSRKLERAKQMLTNSNLDINIEYAYSNTIAAGTVISQDISPDSKVPVGTTVTVIVSQGARDDSKAQQEQATKRAEEPITNPTKKSDDAKPKPDGASPLVTAPPTTSDTRVKVPDVVGLSETSAKNRLDNFNVTIVYVYSSRTAKGYVAEQSLENGSKVNKGSSITLKVSAGAAENAWRTSSSWPSGGNTNYTVEYRKKYKTQSGYNKDNWVFTGSYQNEYCDFYRLTDSGGHSERHENSEIFNIHNDKAGSYVNGNKKVVVTENGETGNYYYFHWCRGRTLQGGPTNSSVCIGGQYQCRTGDKTVTFQSPHYHAFVGDGYVDRWSGNVCQKANWANCADSYWYYRIPIRRQTISSYENRPVYVYNGVWTYTGETGSWSSTTSRKDSYSPSNSSSGYDIEYRYRENLQVYD